MYCTWNISLSFKYVWIEMNKKFINFISRTYSSTVFLSQSNNIFRRLYFKCYEHTSYLFTNMPLYNVSYLIVIFHVKNYIFHVLNVYFWTLHVEFEILLDVLNYTTSTYSDGSKNFYFLYTLPLKWRLFNPK